MWNETFKMKITATDDNLSVTVLESDGGTDDDTVGFNDVVLA